MSQRTIRPSALGVVGAYFFLFLLVFWPAVDFLTTVWSPRLGSVEWRYGAVGLMAAYLTTPILGIGLAMVLAYALRHTRTLLFLSVISLLGALFLIPAMGSFALDVLQLRNARPPEALPSFQAGALIAEMKHLTAFVALSLFCLGGWKTAGDLSKRAQASEPRGRSGEVVGLPKTPREAPAPK